VTRPVPALRERRTEPGVSGRLRAARLVVPALVPLLVTVACSSETDGPAERTPEQVLATAKQRLDVTSGVHITVTTEQLPPGVAGLLGAQGVGVHPPAFEGTLHVVAQGITADVDVIAVDGAVYAKLPFTSRFVTVDPADYNAPDPAELMATEGGLSSLLTAAEQVARGEQRREGANVLTTWTGTVPGQAVAAVIPTAATGASFDASFAVSDDQLLHTATLTGPFYPDADPVTYTLAFDDYGTTARITAP
jgi:lipoprotein LprG